MDPTIDQDQSRPFKHYEPIFNYFAEKGYDVLKLRIASVTRNIISLIIHFRGVCPIHDYEHTSNHFYLCWRYRNCGADFISCHHGEEKKNRIMLRERLDIAHLA